MTAIIPPPQHLVALAGANRIRLARADLKARVINGETSVADVLREMPDYAEAMTVYGLLCAQRWWGRSRTLRFLRSVNVSERKQLRSLTVRQRNLLIDALTGPDA